jgi:hypothetical protein
MQGVKKGKNIWIIPKIEMVMHRLVRSSRQPSLESLMPSNARYDRHLEKFVGDIAALSSTAKFTVGDNCMARSENSLCGADGRDTGGGGQVNSGHIEPGAVQEQLCCEDHGRHDPRREEPGVAVATGSPVMDQNSSWVAKSARPFYFVVVH